MKLGVFDETFTSPAVETKVHILGQKQYFCDAKQKCFFVLKPNQTISTVLSHNQHVFLWLDWIKQHFSKRDYEEMFKKKFMNKRHEDFFMPQITQNVNGNTRMKKNYTCGYFFPECFIEIEDLIVRRHLVKIKSINTTQKLQTINAETKQKLTEESDSLHRNTVNAALTTGATQKRLHCWNPITDGQNHNTSIICTSVCDADEQ